MLRLLCLAELGWAATQRVQPPEKIYCSSQIGRSGRRSLPAFSNLRMAARRSLAALATSLADAAAAVAARTQQGAALQASSRAVVSVQGPCPLEEPVICSHWSQYIDFKWAMGLGHPPVVPPPPPLLPPAAAPCTPSTLPHLPLCLAALCLAAAAAAAGARGSAQRGHRGGCAQRQCRQGLEGAEPQAARGELHASGPVTRVSAPPFVIAVPFP